MQSAPTEDKGAPRHQLHVDATLAAAKLLQGSSRTEHQLRLLQCLSTGGRMKGSVVGPCMQQEQMARWHTHAGRVDVGEVAGDAAVGHGAPGGREAVVVDGADPALQAAARPRGVSSAGSATGPIDWAVFWSSTIYIHNKASLDTPRAQRLRELQAVQAAGPLGQLCRAPSISSSPDRSVEAISGAHCRCRGSAARGLGVDRLQAAGSSRPEGPQPQG